MSAYFYKHREILSIFKSQKNSKPCHWLGNAEVGISLFS
ncbi:hypothetical protein L289_3554 [Acinetobacter gerneri DSM 14967 = CIP 107464 = MTCC 9824]|nr:hypothetical protein L289_3554 [Acinetobacter gerneri DSM 14967 = CIP 107464 = MTCC 9824]